MCVLVALIPMSIWLVISYLVFFLARRSEGRQQALGRALGIWALGIALFFLLAGFYVQFFTNFQLEEKAARILSGHHPETTYVPPTQPGAPRRSF